MVTRVRPSTITTQRSFRSCPRSSSPLLSTKTALLTRHDASRRRLDHHHHGDVLGLGQSQSIINPSTVQSTSRRFKGSALPYDDGHDDDLPTPTTSTTATTTTNTIPFLLADIGEGIAEVELMQWFVQRGDIVQQFDRICEVQSDKATVEITSRYDGMVDSLEHNVGDMVKVGTPLLYMVSSEEETGQGEKIETVASSRQEQEAQEEPLRIPTIAARYHFQSDDDDGDGGGTLKEVAAIPPLPYNNNNNKVQTSPAIRKLAREHDLDLSTIVGTGPKGRVTKGDVLTVLRERGMVTSTNFPSTTAPVATPITAAPTKAAPPGVTSPDTSPSTTTASATSLGQVQLPLQHDTVLQLRGYNRLMVQSMTASLQIPHMVYSDEIDLTTFLRYKKAQPSQKLGFLPFAIKAVSKALEKYPLLNASYQTSDSGGDDHQQQSHVTMWKDHNIGIAMDTPRGLVVPVLKQCQDQSIPELANQLKRLKEAALTGTIPVEDLTGATFTLSNIGAIGAGGTYMCPVVTSPQVAIGALGKIQRLPRFVSSDSTEVHEAHICVVSWGGDHRVVDGATMARFHTQWKEYMEDPLRLLLEMK